MESSETDHAVAMPRRMQLVFGAYFVGLSLALLYFLVERWPAVSDTDEKHYLVIVLLAAALGGNIQASIEFAYWVGHAQTKKSWALWYLMQPITGMVLALIVYFALRAGLLTASAGAENMNRYGVAAIAGLTGMFSDAAGRRLKDLFEALLRPPKDSQ